MAQNHHQSAVKMPETASGELETDMLFSSVPTIVLTSTLAPLSFHEISSAQTHTHTHPRCSNYLSILSSNACISVYVCICLNSGCLSHYILSHSTVSHLSKFNRKPSEIFQSILFFISHLKLSGSPFVFFVFPQHHFLYILYVKQFQLSQFIRTGQNGAAFTNKTIRSKHKHLLLVQQIER